MIADPQRHFVEDHRPGAGDAARRRGGGEGRAVVSSMALVVGRELMLGTIMLCTLLGVRESQATAYRAEGAPGNQARRRTNNNPLTPVVVLAASRGQKDVQDLGPLAMLGRRMINPALAIDFNRRPRSSPGRHQSPDHSRNHAGLVAARSVGRAGLGPSKPIRPMAGCPSARFSRLHPVSGPSSRQARAGRTAHTVDSFGSPQGHSSGATTSR